VATVLKDFLIKKQKGVVITVGWNREEKNGSVVYEPFYELIDQELDEALKKECARSANKSEPSTTQAAQSLQEAGAMIATTPQNSLAKQVEEEEEEDYEFTTNDFAQVLWAMIPASVPFNEEIGRLPNTVEIDLKGNPTGVGARAAANFLTIAGVNLKELLQDDKRTQENKLKKANSRVSVEFNEFWSQTIGNQGKLELRCEIDRFGPELPDKAGKPHLIFWISDGNTHLYPKQRSQGVRWFVSFYLQLKASEKSRQHKIFLLDEPGANLHSKAQSDVLKLVNKLAKDCSTVVYTTHSPQMIEYPKLYRVHAVQRAGDLDDSPTVIIDAHRLGAASSDTLSPVLLAMGADLSSHLVVKKKNNVLLEEMSGHYYLQSFWKLMNPGRAAYFISATGVNKLELLANMFKGWGLHFVVAIDDDAQGRAVFNSLKREHFGDDELLAKKCLVKLPNGTGIEDTFSKADFSTYVLEDSKAKIETTNTQFLKNAGRSKPVMAFHFYLKVEGGDITLDKLSEETRINIGNCVGSIFPLLSDDTN